ncbi:IS30 family transposase [Novosphingobium colocasiae]
MVARSLDLAEKTVEMIESEGGDAFAYAADVTRQDDCRSVVEMTLDRFGRLDCLDNNVGTSAHGDVTQISIEKWREVFSINVESMVMMCKYAIPAMITSGGGSIVNISSLRSIRPQNSTVYSVSKGAVNALTATLAADHGASGIRVNGIILGPVHTPAVAPMLTPERRQTRIDASLIKREGTGWDTGHLVRFLLSEQARFITGQNICLDGGDIADRTPTVIGAISSPYAQAQTSARRWSGSRLERDEDLRDAVLDRLAAGWSPEQIAGRFQHEEGRKVISHETIYRFVYAQLKRTNDTKWRLYLPRVKIKRGWRTKGGWPRTNGKCSIHDRPKDIASRQIPGHWEADCMLFRTPRTRRPDRPRASLADCPGHPAATPQGANRRRQPRQPAQAARTKPAPVDHLRQRRGILSPPPADQPARHPHLLLRSVSTMAKGRHRKRHRPPNTKAR